MRALLTNDDGVDAPGLAVLHQVVGQLMEPVVVAPDQHLSGCGHQVTVDRPLRLQPRAAGWHALDGTPADCTRVGLHLLERNVDWVFSGVNQGGNLGIDTYMSGTVAAVREAAASGVPAVAFSQYRNGPGEIDWQQTSRMLASALRWVLSQPSVRGTFWNINFPDVRGDEGRQPELILCPMDPHPVDVQFEVQSGEYAYRGVYQQRPRHRGTDVDRCFGGDIAITRLAISGHDHPGLDSLIDA